MDDFWETLRDFIQSCRENGDEIEISFNSHDPDEERDDVEITLDFEDEDSKKSSLKMSFDLNDN